MTNQLTRKVGFKGEHQNWNRIGSHNQLPTKSHGVEVSIESVKNDNSHLWVRISHGLNKLATDLDRQEVRRRAGDL